MSSGKRRLFWPGLNVLNLINLADQLVMEISPCADQFGTTLEHDTNWTGFYWPGIGSVYRITWVYDRSINN